LIAEYAYAAIAYDPVAVSKVDVSRANDDERLFASRTTTVTVLICSPVGPPVTVVPDAKVPVPPEQPVNDVAVSPVYETVWPPTEIVEGPEANPAVETTEMVAAGSVTELVVVVLSVVGWS
jgi:hypothetical protein